MSHQALARLTANLTAAWTDQREARRHHRRGGQRRHAPGGGGVPKLNLADRVVAALLHLRFHAPSVLIGQLLGANRITAARAVKEILPLLKRHGHLGPAQPIARIPPSGPASSRSATTSKPASQKPNAKAGSARSKDFRSASPAPTTSSPRSTDGPTPNQSAWEFRRHDTPPEQDPRVQRMRSRSSFARPYICRLIIFKGTWNHAGG
jgi:hypothetical protein